MNIQPVTGVSKIGIWKTPQPHYYCADVKCADCIFVQLDKTESTKLTPVYECGNPYSEYYKSILNMTPGGIISKNVSWSGCDNGVPKA